MAREGLPLSGLSPCLLSEVRETIDMYGLKDENALPIRFANRLKFFVARLSIYEKSPSHCVYLDFSFLD